MKQTQRGGDGSLNIQTETVILQAGTTLTGDDVRAIARDLMRENMVEFSRVAKDTVEARVNELMDKIAETFAQGRGNPSGFVQPEKQLALLDAQKGYATSGDGELKDDLVSALTAMSEESERSLKSIVLHEAIRVLPSLTRNQITALTTAFVVRFVTFNGAGSLKALFDIWETLTHGETAKITRGDFRHLDYCGCARRTLGGVSFAKLLRASYPGLVAKGMTEQELIDSFGTHGIPMGMKAHSLLEPGKFQIAAVNQHVFEEKFGNLPPELQTIGLQILKERILSEAEVVELAKQVSPYAAKMIEDWKDGLHSVEMTSVGLAVGHTRVSMRDPSFSPLEIWLE